MILPPSRRRYRWLGTGPLLSRSLNSHSSWGRCRMLWRQGVIYMRSRSLSMGEPLSNRLSMLETTSQTAAIGILDEGILSKLKVPPGAGVPPRSPARQCAMAHMAQRSAHRALPDTLREANLSQEPLSETGTDEAQRIPPEGNQAPDPAHARSRHLEETRTLVYASAKNTGCLSLPVIRLRRKIRESGGNSGRSHRERCQLRIPTEGLTNGAMLI
jgi:hypothetical protein